MNDQTCHSEPTSPPQYSSPQNQSSQSQSQSQSNQKQHEENLKESQWYNPNHPNADWSGFVPPRQCRKHPTKTPKAMQVQIHFNHNGTGICPTEDVDTLEWNKPRLKVQFEYEFDPSNHHHHSAKDKDSQVKKSTFSLIGGPTPSTLYNHNPSNVRCIGWETEAQSAMKQNGTQVKQLTTYGRSIHIRGRRQTVPVFELAAQGFDQGLHDAIQNENPYWLNESHEIDPNKDHDNDDTNNDEKQGKKKVMKQDLNFIGYRSHKGGAAKSFLTGLGKQIMDKVQETTAKTSSVTVAPFATEGNLPTDPYMTSVGERRKDLLLENYSIAVPGYTGTPSFSRTI